jgi:tRNA (adenine22-N1)-methyltransferase
MTAVDNLRRYLSEHGFEIIDENIVREYNHFYFIIKAKKGLAKKEDEIYYEISRILLNKKEPLMLDYINKVLNTNKKIISSLEKTDNTEYNIKIESLKKKNKKIKELIK